MQILVVEDEHTLAALLQSALTEEGHHVTLVHNGNEAFACARAISFDLVVLDLMIPGMDGFAVARRLRDVKIQTPILVLTARQGDADIIRALDEGADDYLTKPFSLEVFLARVRAVSRRGQIPTPVCLEAGSLTLNTATRRVTRENKTIELTPREYSLLELLLRNKDRVLERSKIVADVWGYDSDVGENTLEAFVRLLRQKIEIEDAPKLIRTVRGVGYMLSAEMA